MLEKHPRISILDMASGLGASRAATKQRLDRLLADEVVRVIGLADPAIFGLCALALISVKVNEAPRAVAQAFLGFSAVSWVTTTTDPTIVLAQVAFSTNVALSEFVDSSLRSLPAIDRVDVDLVVAVYNPLRDGVPLCPAWPLSALPSSPLDTVDRAIIDFLRLNGRASFVRLAEAAGVSTQTARQRTLRLLDGGHVRLRTLVDAVAAGRPFRGEVHVRVSGPVRNVVGEIAAMADVHYVVHTLGRFDIYADINSATFAGLLRTRTEIAQLAEVSKVEFFQHDQTTTTNPVWG